MDRGIWRAPAWGCKESDTTNNAARTHYFTFYDSFTGLKMNFFFNQIDITTLAETLERGKNIPQRLTFIFLPFLYFSHMYKHSRKQVYINNSVFEQMFMTHNQKQQKSGTFSSRVLQTIFE